MDAEYKYGYGVYVLRLNKFVKLTSNHVLSGGILDRVDSYIFTGALVYSFVKAVLPLYGV